MASMATARSTFASAVVDGKIYAFNGNNNGWYDAAFGAEVYDPAADSWSAIADPPYKFSVAGVAGVDGKIYIMNAAEWVNPSLMYEYDDVIVYDPATDSYSLAAESPAARGSVCPVSLPDGRVLVLGGSAPDGTVETTVHAYDTAADTWDTAPGLSLLAPRVEFAAELVGTHLYVFGGSYNGGTHANAERLDLSSFILTPILHLTFDDGAGTTAADSSGNGNDGAVIGAAWSAEPGPVNGGSGCLSFDGTDDYVDMNALQLGESFTLMAWVKFPSPPRTPYVDAHAIFGAYPDSDTTTYAFSELFVWTDHSDKLVLGSGVSADWWQPLSGDTWHHVCITVDAGAYKLYVDGALRHEWTLTARPGILNSIGAHQAGAASILDREPWNGLIDEVKAYAYARSAAQIAGDVIGADAYEDDNTFADAREIANNTPQNRTLTGPGDWDYLKFFAYPGAASFSTSQLSAGLDTVLHLYDAAETLLAENDDAFIFNFEFAHSLHNINQLIFRRLGQSGIFAAETGFHFEISFLEIIIYFFVFF